MKVRPLLWALSLLSASLVTPAFAQASKPEFRLGVVLAASGGASSIGLPERSAVALAEEHYAKADLPFSVKFINYDDGSDPTKTTNAVRRLLTEDNAHFVVCCTTTPSSMAIMDTLNTYKAPSVTLAAAASAAEPAADRPYVFKAAATDKMMIERLLHEAGKRKATKIASIFADDSYGESGLIALRNLAPAAGVQLVATERVARTDTNFTPQALRIRQSNPDIVYVHTYTPASWLMQDALRRVGFRGTVIQSQGSASSAFLSLGGKAADGTYVIVAPVMVGDQLPANDPSRATIDAFIKLYDAKFGAGKADNYSSMGWDAVALAVEAFGRALKAGANPADVPAMRAAMHTSMEGIQGFMSTNGPLNFSATNHVGPAFRDALPLTEVRDGRFVLLPH